MSGQIPGQVPNQGGLSQQNENQLQPAQMPSLGAQMQSLSAQMQSLGVGGISGGSLDHPHNTFNMDPELLRAREVVRARIIELLTQRIQQQINETQIQQQINETLVMKLQDIAKRLEEGLFKAARTKEDYMNMSTLDQRLHGMVQRFHHQKQNVNSSPSVGTMIPTPVMSHGTNKGLMVTSSMDTSMTAANASMPPTTVNTGSLLPTGGMNSGSFSRSEGNL